MTGLRLPIDSLKKRLGKLADNTRAQNFKPELQRFTQATLRDCISATPVRSESTIIRAQAKQYEHRINYIPSYHTLENPSLIVNDMGEDWIYLDAKWYRGDWHMPDQVYSAYQMLSQERQRRMKLAERDFIDHRKQARFLYQRTWWQVAQSLGLSIVVAGAIMASKTRKKPAKEPPKAYGQWRGGGKVLSVAIFNPFLDEKTRYWKGNGKAILAQATAKNRARFLKECQDKVKREISAARRTQ